MRQHGTGIRLARAVTECDALINIPVLTAFSIGGLSFGMKNHYGSFDVPHTFHGDAFTPGVVGLNALDPIRTRTRLVVGDMLTPEFQEDATSYAVIGGQAALRCRPPIGDPAHSAGESRHHGDLVGSAPRSPRRSPHE